MNYRWKQAVTTGDVSIGRRGAPGDDARERACYGSPVGGPTGEGDSPGGERRVEKILAKIAGYTREVADDAELAKLAVEGLLMPYDPVWHPKMARWAHAQELPELLPWFAIARDRLERALREREERLARLGFWGRLWHRVTGRI